MKKTGKTRLLIVDDEAVITMQLEGYVTSMGYEVVGTASSGEEAIAMARDLRPDLILSDVVMPGKFDGIEAAVIIKSELDIPVVFLSAYTEERLLERAKDVEPLAYIVKPFTEQSIKASLEIALYKRDMELWRKQAEEELRRSKEALQGLTESLEQRVAERTAALEKSNEQLQEEVAERKRAEDELRESEEKYHSLIESANDAIFITGVETGIILDANRQAEELTGVPRKEFIGVHHTQVCPVEEIEHSKKLFKKYSQFEHSVTSEDIFVRHRNGHNIPVEISSSLIEQGGRKIIQGIFRDVTVRKQTEEKLRAMSKVFMDATDPIFVENLAGDIINVNAEAERAYGWTREELLGRPIDIIIPPEAQKRQLELRPLCLQGKDVRSVECLRHSKSGKMFNVLLTLSLLRDEAGKPAAIATIAKDITALKQVEEELKVRVHQQAVISEVGLRSLSGIDLSTLMDEVVVRVAKTLDVEYCKVLELLPDGKTLLLRAGVGWKEGLVGHATVGTGKDSQAGYTLISHEPVIVEDLGTEKRFSGPPLLIDHGVVSGMSTIIQDGKRPFGILGAHTTIRRTFTRDDINFLQAIANVLAEAVTRKQAEEELRAMSKVFMDATDPIFIEDLDRKIINVNAEAERAYGWTREELLGRPIDIVIPPEAQERQLELRPLCLQGKDVRSVECLRRSKSGKMFNVLLTLSLLSDEAGKPAAIATIAKDITARKQAEKTIEHMAYHDPLTGLPNRKLFSDRLTKAIAHAKRYKQKLAVVFLDLDNFKDVNDALGHNMGDELLKAVAERLKGSLREEDTVARMGGDEFILLLPEIADKEGVATVAQKILMLIGKPLTINNNKLDTTTSIGVALYPDDTNEAETLVRYADAAMYRAKEQGRDNVQFHTPKK